MATAVEKQVNEITNDLTIIKERVEGLRGETEPIREITTRLAVIEHRLDDIARTRDTWGNRVWLIATIALSAFFATTTAVLGALLTFTLNAKK